MGYSVTSDQGCQLTPILRFLLRFPIRTPPTPISAILLRFSNFQGWVSKKTVFSFSSHHALPLAQRHEAQAQSARPVLTARRVSGQSLSLFRRLTDLDFKFNVRSDRSLTTLLQLAKCRSAKDIAAKMKLQRKRRKSLTTRNSNHNI